MFQDVIATAPAVALFMPAAVAAGWFLLVAVVTLAAALHPDSRRRASAYRVLAVLLVVVPFGRRVRVELRAHTSKSVNSVRRR